MSVELLPGGDRGRFCVGEKLLGRRLGWDQGARRRDRFGGRVEAGAQAGQVRLAAPSASAAWNACVNIRSARCLSSPRKLATNCRCASSVSRSASRSSVGVPATGAASTMPFAGSAAAPWRASKAAPAKIVHQKLGRASTSALDGGNECLGVGECGCGGHQRPLVRSTSAMNSESETDAM